MSKVPAKNVRPVRYNSTTGYSNNAKTVSKPSKRLIHALFFILFVSAIVLLGFKLSHSVKTLTYHSPNGSLPSVSSTLLPESECSHNSIAKNIIVAISAQEIWACDYNQVAYTSLVVTGYTGNPEDITPTGTYKIYAKETDLNLIGSDGVTSWDDHVSYWMPFLDNSYGAYGFHDATWRGPNDFGHVSINTPNASHGCVECPLATAKWLYNWSTVGTTVTIKQNA